MSNTTEHTADDNDLSMTAARGTRILERNSKVIDAIHAAQRSVETLRMPLALTIPDQQTSLQFNNLAAQAANALNKAHEAISFMSDITAALMPYGMERTTKINIIGESDVPDRPFETTAAAVCQRLYNMEDGQSLTVTRCGMHYLVQFDDNINQDLVTCSEFCGYLTQDQFDCLYDMVEGSELIYSHHHINFRPHVLRRIENQDQLMDTILAVEETHDESYLICLVPAREPDHFVLVLFNGQSHGFVIDANRSDALTSWAGTMPTKHAALPFAIVNRETVEEFRNNDKCVSLDVLQLAQLDDRDAMMALSWSQ